jgi:hypothetical protein
MKAQPAAPSVRLSERSSVGGVVQIENLSDVPLTGLTAQVAGKPANLTVTLTLQTNVLAGLATTQLSYGISAADVSVVQGQVLARLTSAEGAVLEVPISVRVDQLVPKLTAIPARLETGMKRGVQRLVEFQVVNSGGTNTGPITVSLPPVTWMNLASPNPLPALEPGETNRVILQLTPEEDTPSGRCPKPKAHCASYRWMNSPITRRARRE